MDQLPLWSRFFFLLFFIKYFFVYFVRFCVYLCICVSEMQPSVHTRFPRHQSLCCRNALVLPLQLLGRNFLFLFYLRTQEESARSAKRKIAYTYSLRITICGVAVNICQPQLLTLWQCAFSKSRRGRVSWWRDRCTKLDKNRNSIEEGSVSYRFRHGISEATI